MPEPSILDAHLAEIDRRLRTIQSGLLPDAEPPIVAPEVEPAPARLSDPAASAPGAAPPASLEARLAELVAAHESLLASARQLLASCADSVAVSAGPFAGTDALRRFERTLADLPDVRDVRVREYEGEDRAVVDVQLAGPKS